MIFSRREVLGGAAKIIGGALTHPLWEFTPQPELDNGLTIHPALPSRKGVTIGWDLGSEGDLALFNPEWYVNYRQTPIPSSRKLFRMLDPEAAPLNLGPNDVIAISNEPNDPNQNPATAAQYVTNYLVKAHALRSVGHSAITTAGIADASVWYANELFKEFHRQGAYKEGLGPDAWVIHIWNHVYDHSTDPYNAQAFQDRLHQFIGWMQRSWIREPLILGEWGVAREPSVHPSHYSEERDAQFMRETLNILYTDPVINQRLMAYSWFPLRGDGFAPLIDNDGNVTACGKIYQEI